MQKSGLVSMILLLLELLLSVVMKMLWIHEDDETVAVSKRASVGVEDNRTGMEVPRL